MNRINLKDDFLFETVECLRAGGLVMHPTETCYGLAVDLQNVSALEKLYRVKGRDRDKPVSILVADLEMALKYGEFSEKALELAARFWPGPLTIVVPRCVGVLPENFNVGQDFVGIRCSDHKFCREMVVAFGSAVTTTSANLAGEWPSYEANVDAFGDLAGWVDLVVDGGVIAENKPSTIVKVVGDEVVVLRQGDLVV